MEHNHTQSVQIMELVITLLASVIVLMAMVQVMAMGVLGREETVDIYFLSRQPMTSMALSSPQGVPMNSMGLMEQQNSVVEMDIVTLGQTPVCAIQDLVQVFLSQIISSSSHSL
jgi:hypothetical protein